MPELRSEQFGGQYPVIRKSDLSTPDARRSREVSPAEFQSIAEQGRQRIEQMKAASKPPTGLDRHWDEVVSRAHQESQQEWGGVTVNPRSGRPVQTSRGYSLTVRNPDQEPVSVQPGASREEFGSAMSQARERFSEQLTRQGHHLGVFHDADKGSVDIDPVVIVKNRKDVESIGAYTRATGGAYDFKSGDGYWPPHVKD